MTDGLPWMDNKLCPKPSCDRLSPINTSRIHDHDFIGYQGSLLKSKRKSSFFIQRNEINREGNHAIILS